MRPLLLILLLLAGPALAQEVATTADGRTVILHPDGRWEAATIATTPDGRQVVIAPDGQWLDAAPSAGGALTALSDGQPPIQPGEARAVANCFAAIVHLMARDPAGVGLGGTGDGDRIDRMDPAIAGMLDDCF